MSFEIDYMIVGVGNSDPAYTGTPLNGGYVFANYISNCISMQNAFIVDGVKTVKIEGVPPAFKIPVFERYTTLNADICILNFPMTKGFVVFISRGFIFWIQR